MAPTSDGRVRRCQECGHPVFLCRTRDDALFFGRHGWRVALAGPAAPPGEPPAAWAGRLSHCFAGPIPIWGGSLAARWYVREVLKAAIDAGATMADIVAAVQAFLQDHEVPPDRVRVQLDKVRGLTF
jgi:hypothetical protein